MRMRALCTEMLSMIESGRAKYTYSKIQGVWRPVAAHWCVCRRDSRSMYTASPGFTSRTSRKSSMSRATLSEASIHSVPRGVSRRPSTSGRMPLGSRKPMMPWPTTSVTAAKPPRQRRNTFSSASNISWGARIPPPHRCSSLASTFSSTSESELVLRWRLSSRTSTSVSCGVFVRLPLWPSPIPNGEFT